jgi:hypothetical protein
LALIAEQQPDVTLVDTVAWLRKPRIKASRSPLSRFLDRHTLPLKRPQATERQRAHVARVRRRRMRQQGMFHAGYASI